MSLALPVYSPLNDLLAPYGSSNPIRSMVSGSAKGLIVLDNNALRASNIRLYFEFRTGTISALGSVELWAAGSVNNANFSDGYTYANIIGTGSLVTLPALSKLIKAVPVLGAGMTHSWEGDIMEAVPALPRYTALIVVNRSGGTLDAAYDHKLHASYVQYEFV